MHFPPFNICTTINKRVLIQQPDRDREGEQRHFFSNIPARFAKLTRRKRRDSLFLSLTNQAVIFHADYQNEIKTKRQTHTHLREKKTRHEIQEEKNTKP